MSAHESVDPPSAAVQGRREVRNSGLLGLAQLVLLTTPAYVRMRRHPELEGWGAGLVELCQHDDLAPLRAVVRQLVEQFAEGPTTFAPLFQSLAANASAIGLRTLMTASRVSAENRKQHPAACLMLAWVALCGWVIAADVAGEDLDSETGPGRSPGWPNLGWRDIPAACIAASLQLRGIHGAALLAEKAHAVLQTNVRRRRDHLGLLAPTIAEYRRLARSLADRERMATASLADDLLEACRAGGRARRLVAALLWILGRVPESHAVSAGPEPPGRALLVRLIRSSFLVLPTDPLVQYLWLEMKEVPELDLRAHDSLYVVLNHHWGQWAVDEASSMFGLEAEPSRLCGRTLEALLAGDLDEARAAGFLQAYELVTQSQQTGAPASYLMPRMGMLRFLVGRRLGYLQPEVTEREQLGWLREEIQRSARMRRIASMFSTWPDAGTRTGIALHEAIECLLKSGSNLPDPEQECCRLAIESLEDFRMGALSYWLHIIPPLAPSQPSDELEQLLTEERELLERMRGAYYLTLRPTLPLHTRWSDMSFEDLVALNEPERRESFYSPDGARKEMDELHAQLASLADRMSGEASDYAAMRQRPGADLARLVSMLAHHRRP